MLKKYVAIPETLFSAQSRLLRERLVELETEIERFKSENATLAKLKQENQDTRDHLKYSPLSFLFKSSVYFEIFLYCSQGNCKCFSNTIVQLFVIPKTYDLKTI